MAVVVPDTMLFIMKQSLMTLNICYNFPNVSDVIATDHLIIAIALTDIPRY
jgi:hypothetical protein